MFINKISYALLLFALAMTFVPLFPASECDMLCCQNKVSCCEKQKPENCPIAMIQCKEVVFIPLISAPLAKFKVQIFSPADFLPSKAVDIPTVWQPFLAAIHLPEPQPPPAFLTPLLI